MEVCKYRSVALRGSLMITYTTTTKYPYLLRTLANTVLGNAHKHEQKTHNKKVIVEGRPRKWGLKRFAMTKAGVEGINTTNANNSNIKVLRF